MARVVHGRHYARAAAPTLIRLSGCLSSQPSIPHAGCAPRRKGPMGTRGRTPMSSRSLRDLKGDESVTGSAHRTGNGLARSAHELHFLLQ